jgi:hypothetical protein
LKEEVISVVEGSTVEVAFDDFNFQSITLDGTMAAGKREVNNSAVDFTLKGDAGSASISVKNKNLSFSGAYKNPTLTVFGIKAGNFSLHSCGERVASTDQSFNDDMDDDGNKLVLPVIRIVVVPKTPVASVAVQELIAYLEESYSSSKPVFLQSTCLQTNANLAPKDISNDWIKINKTLDELKIRQRLP